MPSPVSTISQHQSALARYCRTGSYEPIPGVRHRHVIRYRELVYNVVEDILQSAYPLTYELLSSAEWDDLVDRFLSEHSCRSPQVWRMPKELYDFAKREGTPLLSQYPFLLELLYFEWLEVELFMMEDKKASHTPKGDAASDALVLNPEHILQHFHYPLHRKTAAQISAEDKGDYYLVMFRHPGSGSVQFMDLSPALVYLVEQLAIAPVRVTELAKEVCDALNVPFQDDTLSDILTFINRCLDNKLILGFKA